MSGIGDIVIANMTDQTANADSDSEFRDVNPGNKKPRKSKSPRMDSNVQPQQILTLETVRVLMQTAEGAVQVIQTLKQNGCTMPDTKIAEILQFIIAYIDIHLRGSSNATLQKKELCQVMDYFFPSNSEVRQRPGKGFKAVMKSLLRCMGASDSFIQDFGGNQRFWKHVSWNAEGKNKVTEAMQFRSGNLTAGIDDGPDTDDEDKHKLGMASAKSAPAALFAALKAAKRSPGGKSMYNPKYDVLFSRTTWSYYLRVFMPMCDPNLLQSGIKLDLLRGQLSLKGRYIAVAALPPWCTQNETLQDLEVVQSLPPSAQGDFSVDIPLPFDVDRAARKEVHVTDIGIIVSLKRLKEEIPQMEFKVHTFNSDNRGTSTAASQAAAARSVSVAAQPGVPSSSNTSALLQLHHGVPMNYT